MGGRSRKITFQIEGLARKCRHDAEFCRTIAALRSAFNPNDAGLVSVKRIVQYVLFNTGFRPGDSWGRRITCGPSLR